MSGPPPPWPQASLDDLRLFAAVAHHQSFTAAAAAVAVPRSTLSRVVARLEAATGTILLHRTTRRVALSPEGAALLDEVGPALASLGAALRELGGHTGAPRGLLRVTSSTDLATSLLAPALARLVQRWPALRVETVLTLRTVDLVGEQVHAALRVYRSGPTELDLQGRRIGTLAFGWFASPAYLARRGRPAGVHALATHDRIGVAGTIDRARIAVDDSLAALALVEAGAGIGMLPCALCAEAVARGSVVRVLPDHTELRGQLWLMWPQGPPSRRVQVLRDALLEVISEQDHGTKPAP